MIDSETVQKKIKDTAEYLYDLLTDEDLNKLHLKISIVCNKQGLMNDLSKMFLMKCIFY